MIKTSTNNFTLHFCTHGSHFFFQCSHTGPPLHNKKTDLRQAMYRSLECLPVLDCFVGISTFPDTMGLHIPILARGAIIKCYISLIHLSPKPGPPSICPVVGLGCSATVPGIDIPFASPAQWLLSLLFKADL